MGEIAYNIIEAFYQPTITRLHILIKVEFQ